MTPIESIFEIRASLLDMLPYLNSESAWVAGRARGKYEQLVDRFFREHGRLVKPEQRSECLHDYDYFLKLMESTEESYYSDYECSP